MPSDSSFWEEASRNWTLRTSYVQTLFSDVVNAHGGVQSIYDTLKKVERTIAKQFGLRYGEKWGEQYLNMLNENSTLLRQMAEDITINGTIPQELIDTLYQNGHDISTFMNSLDRRIPRDSLTTTFGHYHDTLMQLLSSIHSGDFNAATSSYLDASKQAAEISRLSSISPSS